ncbi:MAG: T9SS type A sorting domain-containing protein [Aureispira sp.]|nr:T9SS type A sorting domain-containing protein [Aureispira sp.]
MIEKKLYSNKICLLICLFIYSNLCLSQSCTPLTLDSIANPGIYNVASIAEADGLRNGPDYSGATIYYPTNASPPFASIVIVPGYLSLQSSIQSWGPFLASHGIVTMTIGTNSIFENPVNRKDALFDAIMTLSQETTRGGSPLNGNLDTNKIAVGGWSMGGGGAQLAATIDTSLKAVVALCPWLDSGQLTPADLNHPVPLLIFSGELDPTAPPASHANLHYDYTPQTTNKLIYEIASGGHFVANSPTGGQERIGKIAVSWLKKHLIGDSCYCPLLLDTPSTASVFMTNIVCPIGNTSVTDLNTESDFLYQLYPNPCTESINLEVENTNHQTSYEIISLTGVKVSSGTLSHQITSIDIKNLPSGIYIMNVVRLQVSERRKFVVL